MSFAMELIVIRYSSLTTAFRTAVGFHWSQCRSVDCFLFRGSLRSLIFRVGIFGFFPAVLGYWLVFKALPDLGKYRSN